MDLTAPVSAEEARAHLEKVLSSDGFVNSHRLGRFLRFVTEHTISGESDSLKEYTLGRDVFDRDDDYDPRTDSIVRVEARRMRRKLKEYYEGPGREERIRIELRPGGYVPRLIREPAQVGVERPIGTGTSVEASPVPDAHTVAVLPFTDLNANQERRLVCQGITEAIIHRLAAIPQLRVMGMTTATAIRGLQAGLEGSCRALGIGTLIEGSVQQSGKLFRITAKRVDVSSGQVRWSERLDLAAADIFTVQDEVSQMVANALLEGLNLTTVPHRAAKRIDREAYRVYLQGRDTWDDVNRERCASAIECFLTACSLAPDHALPYAGLADAYQHMAMWGWMRPREAMPKARQVALRALRIDPSLGEAYAALAAVRIRFERDPEAAGAAVEKALELCPSYSWAHSVKANCAFARGQADAAVRSFRVAWQLDPLNPRAIAAVAVSYWVIGRFDEAEQWFQEALRRANGGFITKYMWSACLCSAHRYEGVLEELQNEDLATCGDLLAGVYGEALGGCGRREEARAVLETLRRESAIRWVDPISMANVHLGLGEMDNAVAALSQALEERSPLVTFLRAHPSFKPLLGDPRFRQLVAETGGS
jgi:serine/threonine-protein kinase